MHVGAAFNVQLLKVAAFSGQQTEVKAIHVKVVHNLLWC